MPQQLHAHTLSNGMALVAERIDHVRSAAFHLLVPAGAAFDEPGRDGCANLLADLMTRGAGERDNRGVSEALDRLGADHGESTGLVNMQFSAAMLARDLPAVLSIYADIVRRPHLPDDELEAARALATQDLRGLDDDPQGRTLVELARRYQAPPFDRDRRGTLDGLAAVTPDDLRRHHRQRARPHGAILAVAGDIHWDRLKATVEELFGDWQGEPAPTWQPGTSTPESAHIEKDIEQTQIALAYPSVARDDPAYFAARGAIGVLSMDMSSRLFTNIREKHGLCYSVYASLETLPGRGTVVAYAGTAPEQAQQTLDLLAAELRKLPEGIDEDELARVKIGLRAGLIMRQESTSARASSLASDWYYLKRLVPLDEVQARVEAVTVPQVLDYARRYPADTLTVVTLGRGALRLP